MGRINSISAIPNTIGIRGEDLDVLECNLLTTAGIVMLPARAGQLDDGVEEMQLKALISPILVLSLTNNDCKF